MGAQIWTVEDADVATATGRVPLCWFCGELIIRDRRGEWLHLTGGRPGAYACYHPVLGWLAAYALPRPQQVRRVGSRRWI